MTLWWIGDVVLLVVILPVVVLLLTTQDQAARTIAGVAEYGGSLDVILDDAVA